MFCLIYVSLFSPCSRYGRRSGRFPLDSHVFTVQPRAICWKQHIYIRGPSLVYSRPSLSSAPSADSIQPQPLNTVKFVKGFSCVPPIFCGRRTDLFLDSRRNPIARGQAAPQMDSKSHLGTLIKLLPNRKLNSCFGGPGAVVKSKSSQGQSRSGRQPLLSKGKVQASELVRPRDLTRQPQRPPVFHIDWMLPSSFTTHFSSPHRSLIFSPLLFILPSQRIRPPDISVRPAKSHACDTWPNTPSLKRRTIAAMDSTNNSTPTHRTIALRQITKAFKDSAVAPAHEKIESYLQNVGHEVEQVIGKKSRLQDMYSCMMESADVAARHLLDPLSAEFLETHWRSTHQDLRIHLVIEKQSPVLAPEDTAPPQAAHCATATGTQEDAITIRSSTTVDEEPAVADNIHIIKCADCQWLSRASHVRRSPIVNHWRMQNRHRCQWVAENRQPPEIGEILEKTVTGWPVARVRGWPGTTGASRAWPPDAPGPAAPPWRRPRAPPRVPSRRPTATSRTITRARKAASPATSTSCAPGRPGPRTNAQPAGAPRRSARRPARRPARVHALLEQHTYCLFAGAGAVRDVDVGRVSASCHMYSAGLSSILSFSSSITGSLASVPRVHVFVA